MATQAANKMTRGKRTGTFRVVATNALYGRLCRQSLKKLPIGCRDRIELIEFPSLENVTRRKAKAAGTVYVSRLADLPKDGAKKAGKIAGEWRQLLFLERLPVEAMPDRLLHLGIRHPHRLHVAADREPELIGALIYRLFSGMAQADGPQPIVDAWVESETLVLLSPTFDRLAILLKDLAKFIGTDREQIEAFEIDEDGRFLFWAHADVHLGWEQLLQIVDPAAAVAAKQRSEKFNQRYGEAIRVLREEHGLKQSEIAGLTERHLRRVEHGEQAASKSTLEALASAHHLALNEYLKALAQHLGTQTSQ